MPEGPKGRRCRFNLRTLLAVFTVLIVGLGWWATEMRDWAHRRQEMRRYVMQRGGLVGETTTARPTFSVLRRWLGDEPIASINLDPHAFTEEDRRRIKEVFPEAAISGHQLYDGRGPAFDEADFSQERVRKMKRE